MQMISSPARAWEEIRLEEDRRKVFTAFVYPMIGLCGIFSCMARKEDSSNPLQNKKNSTATSGLICSIIGIVLSVIVLLIVIIAVAVSVETGDYTTPGYYGSGDYQDACQLFFGLLR